MALSNKSAVESNNIPDEERLDLTIPRNGSLELYVTLEDEDEDGEKTPMVIAGCELIATAKTSYQAAHVAILGTVSERDNDTATFKLTFNAAASRGLGIDVLDLVHDFVLAPTGGNAPRRIWSGLMTLSKGVGSV